MNDLNSRLEQVAPRLEAWWGHEEQEHPCLVARTLDAADGVVPDTDDLETYWNDSEFVMQRQMALLDASVWHGQAVPYHYVDYGSSAMVCALGSEPLCQNKETVWAEPSLNTLGQVMDVVLDPENASYQTIKRTTEMSVALSGNHHMVSLFALNGIADILAGLYGTESFLMDLALRPGDVRAPMHHIGEIWMQVFSEFCEIIRSAGNRGFIGWAGIWAPGTTFPIQEDISYMISPEMFNTFCLPHVVEMVEAMEYPFYHLDGVGALPHLDALLAIEKLKVIQWQPGAGKEALKQWYPLFQRILAAGKSVQLYGQPDEVDDLVANVGTRGVLVVLENASHEDVARLVAKYGG